MPRPASLLKKRLWHRCFPVDFAKCSTTPFLIERLGWLPFILLSVSLKTTWRSVICKKYVSFIFICSGGNDVFFKWGSPARWKQTEIDESSHRTCSIETVVLKISARFTRKHLYQSLFFSKVAGLRPATLLKKRLSHRCFPANFAKFLRTLFYRTPGTTSSE